MGNMRKDSKNVVLVFALVLVSVISGQIWYAQNATAVASVPVAEVSLVTSAKLSNTSSKMVVSATTAQSQSRRSWAS